MGCGIFTRSGRPLARALFVMGLSLLASVALAQTPASGAGPAAPPAEAGYSPPKTSEASVQAQNLAPLDLWSAAAADTGLPADLWRDTAPDLARPVLEALADKTPTPAFASLARRILQTGANAPLGAGSDPSLAAMRVRALTALGDLDGAAGVLSRTPRVEASEALSRAQAEVQLLLGRDAAACETGHALQEGRDGAWWLKLRAYCNVIDKQPAAAQVTLDLWRQGGGKAPAFDRLMNAAAAGTDPGKAALDDPLVYALSRRLNLDLGVAVATAPTPETAALARDAATPASVRLQATARALRQGAIAVETVRDLYAATAAAPTPGAAALSANDVGKLAAVPGAPGEAALYALAATTADPSLREGAVAALLGRAKSDMDFLALARLTAPRIAQLAQAGGALKDPLLFAAAAAMADDAKTASVLRATIRTDAGPAGGPLDLALLDALIDVRAGARSGPVLDRLIERGGAGDAATRARARAAAVLLAERGAPLSPAALAELSNFEGPSAKASPARAAALGLAAERKLTGPTALIALSIALQQGAGLTVADRAAIVAALGRAGLDAAARDVAAEGVSALMGR